MTRIGHITDFHLIEEGHTARRGMARARLRFLSATRALDAHGRRTRVERALADARAAELDHLVITGDVTEDGTAAQFELLAELLAESGIAPERVTLVAGNHDQYGESGWAGALAGPLRPYAATSMPGVVVDLPGVRVTTVPSAVAQHWLWASGRIAGEELTRLATLARGGAGEAAVLAVTHHPWRVARDPIAKAFRGLANAAAARA